MTILQFHDDFEKKLYDLFLNFEKERLISLKGGTKCKIANKQVDVYFNHEDLHVVFECKAGDRPDIRGAIDHLYGIINESKQTGDDWRGVVVVDRPFDNISKEHFMYATARKVLIWSTDTLFRYQNLIKALNSELAFLSLLKAEFGYTHTTGEMISVPAIKTTRFGRDIYSFTVPADILMKLVYVSRATESVSIEESEEGYQRVVNPNRLIEIAKAVEKKGIETNFPNNLIVAFDKDIDFEPIKDDLGFLKIPKRYGIAWLIDGQHRLFSFCKVKDLQLRESFSFLVSGFVGLKPDEQAKIFRTINNEQKKIDPNLIDFILSKELDGGYLSIAARAIVSFRHQDIFDKDIKCGFNKGKISLHTLVRALTEYGLITAKGGFIQKDSNDDKTPKKIMKDYFEAIKESCHTNWKKGDKGFVQTNNGLAILIWILSKILKYEDTRNKESDLNKFNKKLFRRYLDKLKGFRFDDDWRKASSEASRKDIAEILLKKLKIIG